MADKIKFIKNFSGFSGCEIKLCSCEGKNFVRKISASKEYNERLKKQMEKQIYFDKNLAFDNVKTPKVLGSGMERDLFFFDMEYINGVNLIEYILESSPRELRDIVSTIIKILERMSSMEKEEEVIMRSMIEKKIEEIKLKLFPTLSFVERSISRLNIVKENVEGLVLKKTACHGDLTFENILYDKHTHSYYLIDFLDNFVENYFFDIVKLFQDLEGEWYLLRNPKIDKKSMKIKMGFIKDSLLNNYVRNGIYSKYHYSLLKLNFARILPYARGKDFGNILEIMDRI